MTCRGCWLAPDTYKCMSCVLCMHDAVDYVYPCIMYASHVDILMHDAVIHVFPCSFISLYIHVFIHLFICSFFFASHVLLLHGGSRLQETRTRRGEKHGSGATPDATTQVTGRAVCGSTLELNM